MPVVLLMPPGPVISLTTASPVLFRSQAGVWCRCKCFCGRVAFMCACICQTKGLHACVGTPLGKVFVQTAIKEADTCGGPSHLQQSSESCTTASSNEVFCHGVFCHGVLFHLRPTDSVRAGVCRVVDQPGSCYSPLWCQTVPSQLEGFV